MSFTFDPNQLWEVSTGTLLPAGNHVCEIEEIDATQKSRSGYPEVRLKLVNPGGEIRDWITISSPATFGKFTALVVAAGVPEADYPQPGRDFSNETGEVSQSYCEQHLRGKQVGVVIRDEPKMDDPTQMRPRVKGYVPKDRIAPQRTTGSDVPSSAPGLHTFQQSTGGGGGNSAPDVKIPFAPSVF